LDICCQPVRLKNNLGCFGFLSDNSATRVVGFFLRRLLLILHRLRFFFVFFMVVVVGCFAAAAASGLKLLHPFNTAFAKIPLPLSRFVFVNSTNRKSEFRS
jgi:hypothetical protein